MSTMNQALAAAQQMYQVNPVSPPALTPTAAYSLGRIDGSMKALDMQACFTPYAADYQRGYLDGALCTVKEVNATTRYARVEFERAWMHEWLPLSDLRPVPSAKLPLGTPVRVACLGIEGVISGQSTADSARYRVSWLDRHFWIVRHKWVTKGVIEVIGAAENAAGVSTTAALSA